jgi:hypothetical protein
MSLAPVKSDGLLASSEMRRSDRRIVESQSPGRRSTWSTSKPWRDLNQIRSSSTRLTIAIGTENRSAAMAATRSNDPSGGVSRISYLRSAASRKASSLWMSFVESWSIVAAMPRFGSRCPETVLATMALPCKASERLQRQPRQYLRNCLLQSSSYHPYTIYTDGDRTGDGRTITSAARQAGRD